MDAVNSSQLFQNALTRHTQAVNSHQDLAANLQNSQNLQNAANASQRVTPAGQSFFDALSDTADQARQAQYSAEAISRKALVGEANLTELVPALLNAETTLNTIVTVRDRVVEAYREILRMPI